MKKFYRFGVILFASMILVGCAGSGEKPEETTDEEVYLVGTPTLEELSNIGEDNDHWGHYKAILAFLDGDVDALAEQAGFTEDDEFSASDYEFVKDIKISTYEVTETETKDIIFKFTVAKSDNELFPVGEYSYNIGVVWQRADEYSVKDEYSDLFGMIDTFSGHGCVAWENGAEICDDNGLGFDFGVVRAIDNYTEAELTEENVKYGAEKLFEIEDFAPKSEYLKLVDGKWQYTQYIGNVNISRSITDIRKSGDKIEVDVQYYADRFAMVPSHKVTVYVTETTDHVYKYCFEKSVVTDESSYMPLRWSV